MRNVLAGLAAATWMVGAQLALAAEGSLMGRAIEMRVVTYDDPAAPHFQGKWHRSKVTEGIEFGLGNEGQQNDVDVVPLLIDISDARVEIRYSIAPASEMMRARFNGYELVFSPGCGDLERGRVDREFTNLPFDNKRVEIRDGRLYLDVSALKIDPTHKLAVDLSLSGC